MSEVVLCALQNEPIDSGAVLASVKHKDLGGVVSFSGEVRQNTEGEITQKLFYEAHPTMAQAQMRRIAEQAAERWNARVSVVHRLGELLPGETAVLCVAACAHRAEAFECCRFLIDQIKQEAPIWKKDFSPEGEFWIGS